MIAFLITGGRGTRLRPLTLDRPKHILPILNRPLILHAIDKLTACGRVDSIQVVTGYGRRLIEQLVGSLPHVTTRHDSEQRGCWRFLTRLLVKQRAPCIVWMGDTFCASNLRQFIDFALSKDATLVALSAFASDAVHWAGDFVATDEGRVLRYTEKEVGLRNEINTGIYFIRPKKLFSAELDISGGEASMFPLLVCNNELYKYRAEGLVININTPSEYLDANLKIAEMATATERISATSVVNSSALVDEISVIGPNCQVMEEARILETVLIEAATVSPGEHLHRVIQLGSLRIQAPRLL